ncbi:hypothetical protein [Flavobacteriaceae bacterium 14752]|uniref:hypothetical protein n=1 Tax=Mesohalobacter salilacus TaxID=2491711 RepID=UPI000F637D27|nr:hypothetical protein EIG84_12055 [Flavobacteriaceae bacterium 14752]
MFSNLENGQVTAEAQAFFDVAVQELQNNPDAEVVWEDRIIYSIDKDCQNQIIKDLLNTSSPLTNLINQVFNSNNKVNVKFSNTNIPEGNAFTNPIPFGNSENFTINIVFDNNFLDNSTNIGIAVTALHELVHAQLMQLFINGDLTSNSSNYNDLLNAFIAFYDNQVPDTFSTLDNEIHNAMIDFIENIGNSLFNYTNAHGIDITPEEAVKLAWGSMSGTELFDNVLSESEQTENNNLLFYEQENEPQAKGTPCN